MLPECCPGALVISTAYVTLTSSLYLPLPTML